MHKYVNLELQILLRDIKIFKANKQQVMLIMTYQKLSQNSKSRSRYTLQINLPSWCWNILIGRNVNFAVTNRPNVIFKSSNVTG
jgi:hypothetical protein